MLVLSDDQLAVVDELIDTMDLSTAGRYFISVNFYDCILFCDRSRISGEVSLFSNRSSVKYTADVAVRANVEVICINVVV